MLVTPTVLFVAIHRLLVMRREFSYRLMVADELHLEQTPVINGCRRGFSVVHISLRRLLRTYGLL